MEDRYDSLVAHIAEQIAIDDDDQSRMLADVYETATEVQKDALDRAFICLCGWSLKTLMKQIDGVKLPVRLQDEW